MDVLVHTSSIPSEFFINKCHNSGYVLVDNEFVNSMESNLLVLVYALFFHIGLNERELVCLIDALASAANRPER